MREVAAAVIVERGRLLLTRRPFHDRLAGYWELPGGKIESGETPQQALARELHEELAMQAEIGEVLAHVDYEYQHGQFRVLALRAYRSSDFDVLAHDAFAWVAPDEISLYDLAPADVALVDQLLDHGCWSLPL